MSGRSIVLLLRTRQAAHRAIDESPDHYIMHIGPPVSTQPQIRKFNWLIGLAITAGIQWDGRFLKHDEWKALFVFSHNIATHEDQLLIRNLENDEPVNVRESTKAMTIARMQSLIEYTIAFLVSNGVHIPPSPSESDEIPGWVRE